MLSGSSHEAIKECALRFSLFWARPSLSDKSKLDACLGRLLNSITDKSDLSFLFHRRIQLPLGLGDRVLKIRISVLA